LKEEELHKVIKELKTVFSDIKAEAIILELQKSTELNEADFLVKNKGAFNRAYKRDTIKYDSLDEKLVLNLSRNGIYDTLPEGVFHENDENGDSYHSLRKKKKQEEEDARLLFTPLENEFFNQLLKVEEKEKSLYDNFYDLNSDFLLHFWNLKEEKQEANKYFLKLVRLLPYSHKIAGNERLMALSLEQVLEEKVTFKKSFTSEKVYLKNSEKKLGVNFVTDSGYSEISTPLYKVTIGPIKNVQAFFDNKEILSFLEVFYSYFIPLEFKVSTTFVSTTNQSFVLNEKESPIMGVSTKI